MKLGGITWWRNNYGSILQAYALQQEIEKIDGVSYEIINQFGQKIASVDNLLAKLKNIGMGQTLKRIIWKFGLKGLRARVSSMQEFVNSRLHVSSRVYNEDNIGEANEVYDGFICGSDQIWNPVVSAVGGMYWLDFAHPEKRKIAYAPSVGITEFDSKDAATVRNSLSSFDFISCREKSGAIAINKVLVRDVCENVVDPTMLMEPSDWDKIAAPRRYHGKYIFTYLLRGTKSNRKFIEKFAETVGLHIVTIPFLETEYTQLYDFKFGDEKCWDASPADFISLIKNAEYVFTDSFHCTVFSCIYHKNFYLFPKIGKTQQIHDAQAQRVKNIHEMFGLDNRMVNEDLSPDQLLKWQDIDWKTVDLVMEENRNRSKQLLGKAIGNPSSED